MLYKYVSSRSNGHTYINDDFYNPHLELAWKFKNLGTHVINGWRVRLQIDVMVILLPVRQLAYSANLAPPPGLAWDKAECYQNYNLLNITKLLRRGKSFLEAQ